MRLRKKPTVKGTEPAGTQEPDESFTGEELAVLESGMWRAFVGACVLCGVITLIALVMLAGLGTIPRYILAGFPSIMLWALIVTLHAHHNLSRFAQQAVSALLERTFLDEATGVFNFAYLNQRLTEEHERIRRYGGSAAVLFVDLDHFKDVNDLHGHMAGNMVLREIASELRRQVRACDMFGRVGGDEFMALLPQTALDQAMGIAERLRQSVERLVVKLSPHASVDFVRASIGVAVYPEHGDSMESIVTAADHAVYTAKELGGNKVSASTEFITHKSVEHQITATRKSPRRTRPGE